MTRPTEEQWRVIKESDRHLLVSAGAGTGKTTTVINHVLYLIGVPIDGERIEKPLSLEAIAAITFTNAAAADLKKRLRARLREAGRREESYLIDTLRIGTIHAFCTDVLREFSLRSGSHPYPEIIDEGEASALAADSAREAVLHALEEDTIPGLDTLFREHSVPDVERHITTLIAESDRLRGIASKPDGLDEREGALVALARGARAILNDWLDERGVIDFDQMIVRTRDLLRAEPVRRSLQRRLKVLIVDEFQDVDPVQREIAYLLGEPGSEHSDTTRLVIVGDPKQSIYRFRRADVTVWNSVRTDFASWPDCDIVSLSHNYRSTSGILGFVDHTVGKILARPADGSTHAHYEVPFEPLTPGSSDQERDLTVELLVVPTKDGSKDYDAESLRKIEAAAVAKRAAELVESGEAGWGGMAVILTGWGALATYRSALESVGAKTYAYLSEGFYERREVLDLILALDAARDPTNDLALFGFLRSPFVGLKDETLLAAALQLRRPYWWNRRDLRVAEQEGWNRGCEILERYAALRDRMPTDRLLAALLEDTGYLAHLELLGERKAQAIANVRKFIHLARGMRQLGVGDFLRTIEEARARDDREPDAPLTGQEDAVTITSIHGAKGLEWDIVFFSDTQRGPINLTAPLLVSRDTLSLKNSKTSGEDSPRHADLKGRIVAEDVAERKRLWYVAMTRAKRRLIVSGLPAGKRAVAKSKTPAEFIWKQLPEVTVADRGSFEYASHDRRVHHGMVGVSDPSALHVSEELVFVPEVQSVDALVSPYDVIAVPAGRTRHSATEFLTLNRCGRKHWFKYILGVREPEVGWKKEALVDAITRGLIVHDVLERLQEAAELDALLEDAIERYDEDAPPLGSKRGGRYRRHLAEEVRLVAGHREYRAVADLPGARRELGFACLLEGNEHFEGSFDLAARESDGLVIIDVKTSQCDARAAARKAAQYGPQRDVYVAAAEQISQTPVERFGFQFSRAAMQISEEIDGETRIAITRRVLSTLQRIHAGNPPLTDHPAECAFCGFKKVGWCEGVSNLELVE